MNPRLRPVAAKLPHDPFERFDAARRGILIRWARPRSQQVLAAENVQRRIAVVAVKEPPFLVPVQRVAVRIEVEPELARRPTMRLHIQLHNDPAVRACRPRQD